MHHLIVGCRAVYYDSQLLEKAAKESGLSIKYLESQDEQGITLPTIYQSIGFGTKDYVPLEQKAANAQREIIEKIAAEGPCVIVGRRADLILRGKSDIHSREQKAVVKQLHDFACFHFDLLLK